MSPLAPIESLKLQKLCPIICFELLFTLSMGFLPDRCMKQIHSIQECHGNYYRRGEKKTCGVTYRRRRVNCWLAGQRTITFQKIYLMFAICHLDPQPFYKHDGLQAPDEALRVCVCAQSVCVSLRGFACGFFRHRGQPVNQVLREQFFTGFDLPVSKLASMLSKSSSPRSQQTTTKALIPSITASANTLAAQHQQCTQEAH